jgi:hypothetical protein
VDPLEAFELEDGVDRLGKRDCTVSAPSVGDLARAALDLSDWYCSSIPHHENRYRGVFDNPKLPFRDLGDRLGPTQQTRLKSMLRGKLGQTTVRLVSLSTVRSRNLARAGSSFGFMALNPVRCPLKEWLGLNVEWC